MTPIEIVVGFFAALGILWWLKDAFGFSPRGGVVVVGLAWVVVVDDSRLTRMVSTI